MTHLQKDNKARLKELANENKFTEDEMLKVLLDVYTLNDLSELINKIQRTSKNGITPNILNTLHIFFSYLASLLSPYTR